MATAKSTEAPPSFESGFGRADEVVLSPTEGTNEVMPSSATSSAENEMPQNEVIEMDYEDSPESITQTSSMKTSSTQSFSESAENEVAAPSEEPEETIVFVRRKTVQIFLNISFAKIIIKIDIALFFL